MFLQHRLSIRGIDVTKSNVYFETLKLNNFINFKVFISKNYS